MFVVVGEALVDLVGQRGGRTFSAHPGGSPANVALGLARLGVPVTLKTRLGRDAVRRDDPGAPRSQRRPVDGGPDEEGAKTSLAIATLAAGIASYDFRIDWDVGDLAPLPVETRCLHTGSLATVLAPGKADVVDLVEREHERGRVTVSYDPNVRPALLGRRGAGATGHRASRRPVRRRQGQRRGPSLALPRPADEDVAQELARLGARSGRRDPRRRGRLRRLRGPGAAPGRGADRSRGHRRRGRLLHLRSARRAAPCRPGRRRAPRRAGGDRRGNARQRRRCSGPDRRDHMLPARVPTRRRAPRSTPLSQPNDLHRAASGSCWRPQQVYALASRCRLGQTLTR